MITGLYSKTSMAQTHLNQGEWEGRRRKVSDLGPEKRKRQEFPQQFSCTISILICEMLLRQRDKCHSLYFSYLHTSCKIATRNIKLSPIHF